MRAYLFPGQGSQFVGMGREAYIENGSVRDIFDRADGVLGYKLSGIMFEGDDEELRKTLNAQPAIFLHSYALYQMLDDPQPSMAAGHSLGEYTALAVANALTFDDALKLVQLRAQAMWDAGVETPGTMAAIIGMDDDAIGAICSAVNSEVGVVQSANFNSPGQVVISGSPDAIEEAMKRAKESGARMAKQLNVSGAFHSPLMEPARERLAAALAEAPIQDAEFAVYVNVTGTPVVSADDIRNSLLQQLTAPVQWTKTIERMVTDGATELIEVGPGNVLQGLAKRIATGVEIRGVDSLEKVGEFNG